MYNIISINIGYNPGSFAHEFAHYVVEKTKFNEGLLECLKNVFNSGIAIYERQYKKVLLLQLSQISL